MAKCPLCSGKIPPKTVIVCPACWWNIPAPDRLSLHEMHKRKEPTDEKLAAIKRRMQAVAS